MQIMKKKIIALLACVVAVLALLSGGSLAYFTVTGVATNVVTTGGVSLKVHETTADGSAFPAAGVTIMPGDTVSKIVRFENTGTAPLYLRVKLQKGVQNSTLLADCVSVNLNNTKWTYKDGYYYYSGALAPGKTTENMFTEVKFDGSKMGNAYIGKVFTLDITAYAVQSEHNGATVWDAAGWPS